MGAIRYSFVIPIYNEEESLPHLESALAEFLDNDELSGSTEVVLVDDGSTDRSWAMMADLATRDKRFVAVRLSRNFGHQFALTAGYSFTVGDAVISMDADLQDPIETSLDLIEKYKQGFDVVYAVRAERKGETFYKLATAAIFYKIMSKVGETRAPKNCGDFRLMSRRAVEAFNRLPERHRYIRGLVGWIGFNTATVEYIRQPRVAGRTKFPSRKMIGFALDAIVSMSSVPLRFAYVAALLGSAVFLGYVTRALYRYFILGVEMVPGWTSLIVSVVVFGALNLLCLGLIGEYVGRIYQEVKKRPLYLVSGVIRDGGEAAPQDWVARPGTEKTGA